MPTLQNVLGLTALILCALVKGNSSPAVSTNTSAFRERGRSPNPFSWETGPLWTDVYQNRESATNCWLVSAMKALAYLDPFYIESLFDLGDWDSPGTYHVTLPQANVHGFAYAPCKTYKTSWEGVNDAAKKDVYPSLPPEGTAWWPAALMDAVAQRYRSYDGQPSLVDPHRTDGASVVYGLAVLTGLEVQDWVGNDKLDQLSMSLLHPLATSVGQRTVQSAIEDSDKFPTTISFPLGSQEELDEAAAESVYEWSISAHHAYALVGNIVDENGVSCVQLIDAYGPEDESVENSEEASVLVVPFREIYKLVGQIAQVPYDAKAIRRNLAKQRPEQ